MACFFGQLPLDRQGFGPGELSNALASALRPADAFDCPDVQGPLFGANFVTTVFGVFW